MNHKLAVPFICVWLTLLTIVFVSCASNPPPSTIEVTRPTTPTPRPHLIMPPLPEHIENIRPESGIRVTLQANPQNANASYPINNPVRYSEPDDTCIEPVALYGSDSCADTYGGEGYLYWLIDTEAYLPLRDTPVPSLWKIGVEVDGYGVVDLTHTTGSYDITEQIYQQIFRALKSGQNVFKIKWAGLAQSYSLSLEPLLNLYSEDPDMFVDTIASIAYGIFQDFSDRFESFQEAQGLPRSLSAWSQEDFPSNYIGFYAYVYYRHEGKAGAIAYTIERLSGDYSGIDMFQNMGRKNHKWNFIDCGLLDCTTISWPETMRIEPISEGDLWQRQE